MLTLIRPWPKSFIPPPPHCKSSCLPTRTSSSLRPFPYLPNTRSRYSSSSSGKQHQKPKQKQPHHHAPQISKALQADSICFRPGSSTPSPTSKQDKHALAAAQKFFRGGYRFLYSASQLSQHPPNSTVPEVIILGSSNVGKSSLMNGLVGRPDAARVSSRPGSTITTNSFGVGLPTWWDHKNPSSQTPKTGMILVDSPGYGFNSQEVWGKTIMRYLEKRQQLRGAVLLLSLEKDIHPMDVFILSALAKLNKRTVVMVTKADRVALEREWGAVWADKANEVRALLARVGDETGSGWRQGDGWVSDICFTACGMGGRSHLGNGAGIGGARRAILGLAGFNTGQEVDLDPSVVSYEGEIVSFDDIYGSEEAEEAEEPETEAPTEREVVTERQGGRKRRGVRRRVG